MEQNIAQELAKKQQSISIAEFFEKNRQILGFDSAPRSLITTVKEAVDNALDACEEANILPDIIVFIENTSKDTLTVIVEDNGPGVVKEQIPHVFAKLLYGSRFHAIKQSRGQQGIGISAAVLYSQLTTGKPVRIISKIGKGHPAHYFELIINTKTNEPEILKDEEVEWDRLHGTRIELEMEASYVKGRRQSVYEYLKDTAIVNPHARITLIEPDGNEILFERASDQLPKPAKEVLPHPHGIELGTLLKMLRYTERQHLSAFLRHSFSKIGLHTAEEICKEADLHPHADPHALSVKEAKKLIQAFKKVKIMAPPTDCLSPIGEKLIYKGLEKEHTADFITTTTRQAAVHSGHPFVVEAGIAFGGSLRRDQRANILRFANRVPLLYQQGACAITHAIENIKWKQYGIEQPPGSLPVGPLIILVHIASTHIPFTSESKEAIADVPEILNEIDLALKELARRLSAYLNKQKTLSKRREKEVIIQKILPRIAAKTAEILQRPTPDISPVVAKIMGNVLIKRHIQKNEKIHHVIIQIHNNSDTKQQFTLYETLPHPLYNPSPEPKTIPLDGEYNYLWRITLKPQEKKAILYDLAVPPEELEKLPPIIVEGINEELVTGAKAIAEL
jgi:DNA topoisomerase-6 subunit B